MNGVSTSSALTGAAQETWESKQVFMKDLNGRTVTFEVSSNYTVGFFKMLIQNKQGIPMEEQRLIFAGNNLRDERTLSSYNIFKEATCHLVLKLKGGMPSVMPIGIDFPDLRKSLRKTFGKTAPDWRRVNKGLNLEGKCVNAACKAYQQAVIVMKEMGSFDLTNEIYDSECPMCHHAFNAIDSTHSATNVIFWACVYKIEGKKLSYDKGKKKIEQVSEIHFAAAESQYITFDPSNEVHWVNLKVTTLPILPKPANPTYDSKELALFGIRLSSLVYTPEVVNTDTTFKPGKVKYLNTKDGFISYNIEDNRPVVRVTFRGTRTDLFKDSLGVFEDGKTDLQCSQVEVTAFKMPGKSHLGFLNRYMGNRKDMFKRIQDMITENDLFNDDIPLVFQGHSLGGALSYLAAADYKTLYPNRCVKLITACSPRVFCPEAAKSFRKLLGDGNVLRIYGMVDPIASLPPKSFNYQHTGLKMRIPLYLEALSNPHSIDKVIDYIEKESIHSLEENIEDILGPDSLPLKAVSATVNLTVQAGAKVCDIAQGTANHAGQVVDAAIDLTIQAGAKVCGIAQGAAGQAGKVVNKMYPIAR